MVTLRTLGAWLVLGLVAGGLGAEVKTEAPSTDPGTVLYGTEAGRVWRWESGVKTYLTPEGLRLTLGGVGEAQLWGWTDVRGVSQLFTLELPQPEVPAAETKAEKPKSETSIPTEPTPSPVPMFDGPRWPVPDRADRVGDRALLVYGALSGHPRYEVRQAGDLVTARAWDDGRVVYALALGPTEGWIVAGRHRDGSPWLEVSGQEVPAPEGWRGRLTVAAWVAEVPPEPAVAEKPPTKTDSKKPEPSPSPMPPPPVHPWVAGSGAPGGETARALFWGPEGWTQPAPEVDGSAASGGVYPVLGGAGADGTLVLAGWRADAGTWALRPWFWDGSIGVTGERPAEGEPQAWSAGDKAGPFLVVRHQSEPWFTFETGTDSTPILGLGANDRVVAVGAAKVEKAPQISKP